MAGERRAHPWMANSAPGIIEAMLSEIGAASVDEVFEQIPKDHFRTTPLDLPPALTSEIELRRDLVGKLKKNASCEDNLSFLGAGVWQHHVPAIVDEIVGRTEFATNVWGSYQSDHGRNQAWFEFNSQLGALLIRRKVAGSDTLDTHGIGKFFRPVGHQQHVRRLRHHQPS